jgi:hypothetical protein
MDDWNKFMAGLECHSEVLDLYSIKILLKECEGDLNSLRG